MRKALLAVFVAAWWFPAAPALAHGIGGRQDLPVPLRFFIVGAATVIVVSFAALAILWPKPRLQQEPEMRRLNGRLWRPMKAMLSAIGLAGLALVVVAGVIGVDNSSVNPGPVLVFVFFWLVVPFASALIGNGYPALSPWNTLARVLRIDGAAAYRWGLWPAVSAFFAFTWFELVAPDTGPRSVAIAALVYSIYLLAFTSFFGREQALRSGDGFAVYNQLFGAIGPIGRDRDGSPGWRGWLRGLPHAEERPGLVVFVVAMIGTVTYDGGGSTAWWQDNVAGPLIAALQPALSRSMARTITGTIGLVGITALIGAGYYAASAIAARLAGAGFTGRQVATRFAHTLVPIGFAYAFAHYFSLIIFEGQLLFSTLSDPFGFGWDLLGTAGRRIDFSLLPPLAIWYVQVGVIVAGHVAGVVLAHDRALADFPAERAVTTQYAMLGLMVLLTGLGLVILAGG